MECILLILLLVDFCVAWIIVWHIIDDKNSDFNARNMRNESGNYSREIEDVCRQIRIAASIHNYNIEISHPADPVIEYFLDREFEIIEIPDGYNVLISWENKNNEKHKFLNKRW